jgi:hypothetical protein
MTLFPGHDPVPHASRPHRDAWVRRALIPGALLLFAFTGYAALRIAQSPAAPSRSLASLLPQGALLTIESPDFATLLQDWNASPEQKAWLASDNYSVFSNSRLFGRLDDARAEFESAAKSSPRAATSIDGDFLTQIAGRQSIFAWYDVGNLEFLYISRISPAQAANLSLQKDRAAWTSRQAGGTTFYLRKSSNSAPAAEQAEDEAAAAQGRARTVAFALVPDAAGDLLVLATREDLIANALQLMHPPAAAASESMATEPWYAEASAALTPAPGQAPALHMVLNLDRLVPLAYFRSYWVQQNVTEMKQYRAAVSDLYREANQFREDRALLLRSSDAPADETYLRTLTALVPAAGVHRAISTRDPAVAVTALEEKLLGRIDLVATTEEDAPDPTLDAPQSGSTGDLETRIDTPPPVTPAVSNGPLTQALKSSGLDAVETWSSARQPASGGLWVPIHSAVVLQAEKPWDVPALQSALQHSLRGGLTTASFGIEFRPEASGIQTIYALNGPKPLFLATLNLASPSTAPGPVQLCLLTDDRALLLALLKQAATLAQTESRMRPAPATLLAGFDHASQRAPFARLTSLIDGTNRRAPQDPANHTPLPFFSGDMRSLSDSFAALAGESFEEHRDGAIVRQSVLYQWRR